MTNPKKDDLSLSEKRFVPRDEMREHFGLGEAQFQRVRQRFPVQWPRYYWDLAQEQGAPLWKMGAPDERELEQSANDIADPIADRHLRPLRFVVRKHPDRVIILATKKCHFYCRFCFRREEPVDKDHEPQREDWQAIFRFLRENSEIKEVILSGGDPLTLKDTFLGWVHSELRNIPSLEKWRIHSRAPVHYPARMTAELVAKLSHGLPLGIITHYNHAGETSMESHRIAQLLKANGISYKNQAVLLRGVNDSVPAQKSLWATLTALGIQPHYLHHPDRAQGNATFRLPLAQGMAIYRGLLQSGGHSFPTYVLDLPDGTGKVPVTDLEEVESGLYRYKHSNGHTSFYKDILY